MDTPDEAAALADSTLADAVNEDWLVLSGRSQSRASRLRRQREQLEWSTNSWSPEDGLGRNGLRDGGGCGGRNKFLSHRRHSAAPTAADESSWLLASNASGAHHKRRGPTPLGTACLLYDNISLADSLPAHTDIKPSPNLISNDTGFWPPTADLGGRIRLSKSADAAAGKFRLFLAFFLLIGITLAIYSRNALSLAAVGMVASNQVNKELVDYLASQQQNGSAEVNNRIRLALDGSCPIVSANGGGGFFESNYKTTPSTTNQSAPQTRVVADRSQLEANFRASVRRRIELGELVDWTPSQMGLIFAAGSLGNLMMAIPLTRLGEVHGPKWVIFGALLGASLQAALMPLLAPSPVPVVILFQVIFNGLTFGADCVAYTLFAHWLTPTEMAFFVASLLVCYQSGTIISSFITAQILSRQLAWSWCFYTPAILCAAWTFLWALVGASEPSKSWLISHQELAYLQRHSKIAQVMDNGGGDGTGDGGDEEGSDEKLPLTTKSSHSVSWLKLARDPNIWAIISVKFTLRWYFSVYNSLMPTYLSSVGHMSVDTIGKVSVIQNVVGLFSGILMSYLTKSVVLKRPFGLSLAAFRKIFQSIVNFGLAISLLIFIAFDCDKWVTICTLTISGICLNFYVAAALQLPLDLSPDHCGLITSLSNTLALGQALGAPISGLILNNGPRERSLWRLVWLLVIVLNTMSGLLFIYLVDSKPRDYNKYPSGNGGANNNNNNDDDKKRTKQVMEEVG